MTKVKSMLAMASMTAMLYASSAYAQDMYGPYNPLTVDPKTNLPPKMTIDTYNPRLLPVVQVPSNRVKDVVGRSVENACIRSGKAAAICATAAVAAGGIGLATLSDRSWSDIGSTVGVGAATGAIGSAVAGCVVGGAIGFWAAGAGAIPGCMMGALSGAIQGGFVGAVGGTYSLLKDGSITVDGKGGMGGDVKGVAKTTPNENNAEASLGVFEGYASNGYTQHLQKYGLGNEFVCKEAEGTLHVCMLFGSNEEYTPEESYHMVYKVPFDPTKDSKRVWVGSKGTAGVGSAACGYAKCDLFMSEQSWAAGTALAQIVTNSYGALTPIPVAAAAFTNAVPPGSIGKEMDPNVVAALATAALRAAGSAAGPAANDTVTAADVTKVSTDDPTTPGLTLGNMMQPVANLNAGGGTNASPLKEPQQVVNVGQSASTGTGTKAGVEAVDKDLDQEAGGDVGNPIQPVIDFFLGPFAVYINPNFTAYQEPCPVWSFDMWKAVGGLFGVVQISSTTQQQIDKGKADAAPVLDKAKSMMDIDSSPVCKFFDERYAQIQQVMALLILVAVFMVFFA